ncbi:MAG: TonB-dependent receptor [Steroidobacteraceae bacterium]
MLGIAVHQPLLAQSSPEPLRSVGTLEEIVVTAQKREEKLSDVAIAIDAFSADRLKTLDLTSSTDIVAVTPGVFISSDTGGQNQKFVIRGVAQNEFLDAVESPIAIYVDDGYIAPQQGQVFGLFDLQRVEVLKGPQGTLFGRNATGGLVHSVSNKPTIGATDGFIDVTAGSYRSPGSSSSLRVEGAKSFSLSDHWAMRLALLSDTHDPLLKNAFAGSSDLYDKDTKAARLHLLWEPTDSFQAMLSGSYAKSEMASGAYETLGIVAVFDDQGRWVDSVLASDTETRSAIGPGGVNVPLTFGASRPTPGGDLFGYREPRAGDFRVNMDWARSDANVYDTAAVQLHLDWNLSDHSSLRSITNWHDYSKVASLDVDASPLDMFRYMADADTETVSQEINYNWEGDRLRYVAGLYFLYINNHTLQGLPFSADSFLAGGAPTGLDLTTIVTLDTKSYSAFAQATWDLTEAWSVVLGGRAIEEAKEYFFAQNAYANLDENNIEDDVFLFPLQGPGVTPFSDDFSQSLWAAKAQFEYRPADGQLYWFGINRGVKAGSVNGPLADGSQVFANQLVYEPETLTSYDLGMKLNPGGSWGLNGSLFYYDYKDYQTFTFVNVSGIITNEDATMKGAELEFTAIPFTGLSLRLAGAYMDAKVKDFQLAPGLTRDVEPVFSPETQFSWLLRYEWPITVGTLAAQYDGSYAGERFSNTRNFTAHRLDSFALHNLRLSWLSPNDKWSLSAFVTNLTDEVYNVERFDLSTLCGCTDEHFGNPRWAGASVRYSF